MTIKEFVLQQRPMSINGWIELIESEGLGEYRNLILDCAEHYNLIIINHSAPLFNSQSLLNI